MKYIKLFENSFEYTPDKLSEIVSNAENWAAKLTSCVEKYASILMSLTLYDVAQEIKKYKVIVETLANFIKLAEQEQERNSNTVDMYSPVPTERPSGTHELISKLEYTINPKISDNSIELSEIKEYIENMINFVTTQKNNHIINRFLSTTI